MVEQDLSEDPGITGPLFLESADIGLRLRYRPRSFRHFGFPVEELAQFLRSQPNRRAWLTVAGFAQDGGLWIEVAPVRIAELPSQLARAQFSGGRLVYLDSMCWPLFSSEDCVDLELVADPLSTNEYIMHDWIAGPRGAFGSERALLPVQRIDTTTGVLVVGEGENQLTLPNRREMMWGLSM